MSVPACACAADQALHQQEGGGPGLRADGRADVEKALVTALHVVALAAAEVAARPGDRDAVAMLGLSRVTVENLGRGLAMDEAILAAREREAYERGAADCKASRCRLQVIDGG